MDTFHFLTKLDQTLLLGVRARNIAELLAGIRAVPDASIYYHTHRFLQQHHFLSPEPPNDFAFWVTHLLGDKALGEKLWSVNTAGCNDLGELRSKLIGSLESGLSTTRRESECQAADAFHFMACRTFVLPTSHMAHDPSQFTEQLAEVVLLMVVVPSRIGVRQYDLMKRQIEELVGKINGRFGKVGWTPEVYQYRNVEFASLVVKLTGHSDLQVVQGSKVVEVRRAGVDKGTAAGRFLAGAVPDIILAVGDDVTDEDMFRALPATAVTIRVGMASTQAMYNQRHCADVIELLRALV